MLYPVKGFGVINETQVDISLFFNSSFRYHSDKNIAFPLPVSCTKPHCSIPISGLILLYAISMMILRMHLVLWLHQVLCSSHSTVPGFLGKAMKIDLQRLSGISQVS